jgi:hypothetical protein
MPRYATRADILADTFCLITFPSNFAESTSFLFAGRGTRSTWPIWFDHRLLSHRSTRSGKLSLMWAASGFGRFVHFNMLQSFSRLVGSSFRDLRCRRHRRQRSQTIEFSSSCVKVFIAEEICPSCDHRP